MCTTENMADKCITEVKTICVTCGVACCCGEIVNYATNAAGLSDPLICGLSACFCLFTWGAEMLALKCIPEKRPSAAEMNEDDTTTSLRSLGG